MPNKPQKFWNFSLELYDAEGVAAACLELQDAYQLDVNLILFCFWHGSAYGKIDQELLQNVIDLSIEWRSGVVQPLRSARVWMKLNPNPSEHFDSLRERIKADELMAEKFQIEQIASLTLAFNRGRQCLFGNDDTGENIDSLLVAAKIERDEKINSALKVIRGAIEV
ncbi:MAG: hypothetical protein ACI8XU_001973 [Kiritimatiellia bacterium]|jgi:uncharacterized protein (TIGR02444 family)